MAEPPNPRRARPPAAPAPGRSSPAAPSPAPTSGTSPKRAERAPARSARPARTADPQADRAAERRCEALRVELETLERARAELCSILSHDLRNPLAVVVWSAQILGRHVPPGDAARRHLDAIARAADEMGQTLHDLGDVARIVEGRLGPASDPAPVAALIEQALAPSRSLIESKALALTLEVAPDLGAVPCDQERVTRVLAGLIAGAVRRTPKHGAITVGAARSFISGAAATVERDAPDPRDPREPPASIRFSVEDGGPDLTPAERASLFTLPSAPEPGTSRRSALASQAVALFVARGVVEAHGGRIWVEGGPGATRFAFTLPGAAAAS